eukprot:CAMPEP_0202690732 /NCGR_PEP_ID=MMETSP1385-20130828/5638_1 /ASSEMBLY_ACC=CAM_ASM_000861 /TAXON_ID=933848 /ORGANISM="Elphidium margaritaceum" /LENGTH=53 /DNA_ID=CAMNT_0049346023 /DNA_START=667 /DNA_END=828 /DNA_ORIENTATION=-
MKAQGNEDNKNETIGMYPSPNPKLSLLESNSNDKEYSMPAIIAINAKNKDANR